MTWKINTITSTQRKFAGIYLSLFVTLLTHSSCGVYSFSGVATNAKTMSMTEFYNNTDLGPANMGQTFSNSLKNYFIQNTSLSIVPEDGELQLEGEITDFKLTQIAPTSTGDATQPTLASATRVTITVKVTFTNTLDSKQDFKSKTFSFYKDFDNTQNLVDVQDRLVKDIFERIINDIFNATVANW